MSAQVKKVFTEAEASMEIGVSRTTMWRLREEGKIPFRQVGRRVLYTQEHLQAFIDRCERQTKTKSKRPLKF